MHHTGDNGKVRNSAWVQMHIRYKFEIVLKYYLALYIIDRVI